MPPRPKKKGNGVERVPKWPLYPTQHGGPPRDDDCPRCGQSWINTQIHTHGACVLCAIDTGAVDVPPDLQANGWHLHRTCTFCISAARHDVRLALPVYASFQLAACIRQAYGYQAAWEWLHEGGAGYSWGWRLVTNFHITYAAVHPTLGRVPRNRYDSIWLDALPERIIEDLVVEALQVQHHRRRIAVVFARYVARRMLAERAAHNAAVFAAIPAAAFEQKELM